QQRGKVRRRRELLCATGVRTLLRPRTVAPRPAMSEPITAAKFFRLAHALSGDYEWSMKTAILFLAASGFLVSGCGDKSGASASGTNASSGSSTPATAPADYVGALGKGQRNAIKTVDTASLNQAIQMFNVDKGRNPKDLNE